MTHSDTDLLKFWLLVVAMHAFRLGICFWEVRRKGNDDES
jgi:hypothetical protein